jgi:CRP/FNR family transcriptional regulator
MTIDVLFLKSIPYFSGLSDSEMNAVKAAFSEKTLQRGEVIFWEGEQSEALFFVSSGFVKIFKTSAQGKEQIVSIARPGEVLNDIPIFDGLPNPISAQALSLVTLYEIKKDNLEKILTQFPDVAKNVHRLLAERMRQLLTLVEDLSFRRVLGRVAKILLTHSADGDSPTHRLTQQEMAAMAGTAREVVARSLKSLEEQGLIRIERQRIVITNKNSLQELVAEPT